MFQDFSSSFSGLVTNAVGTVCNDTSMYFFVGKNLKMTKYNMDKNIKVKKISYV